MNSNNAAIKINGSSQMVEIRANQFDNYTHVGVLVDDSLNNSIIEKNNFVGGVKTTSQAFNFFRVNYTSIQHNWITNCQYGIYTYYCEDNTIWNNTISNSSHGIVCEYSNRDFLIQRNTIFDIVSEPLYFTSSASSFDIHGNIIYDFGVDPEYGTNSFTKWNVINGDMDDMVNIDDLGGENDGRIYFNWTAAREKFAFVTGSGTESDPYVISNYTATSGEYTSSYGVLNIENSNAYVVMENLTFVDCGSPAYSGFYAATTVIDNVTNVIIRDNTFLRDKFCAIWFSNSINNTQIINNRIIDSVWEGLYSSYTNHMVNVTIANNILNCAYPGGSPSSGDPPFKGNYGMTLNCYGENISITSNIVLNYTNGIRITAVGDNLDSPIRIAYNNISNGLDYGLSLTPSGYVIAERNNINNFSRGLYVVECGIIPIIRNNWINGSDIGLYLRQSEFALIQHNTFMYCESYMFYIQWGHNNTISENEIYLDRIMPYFFEESTGDNIFANNTLHTPVVDLTLLSPAPSEDGYIEFEWSAMADITNYLVYRDTSPLSTVDSLVFLLNTTSISFSETLPDNGYYYYVVVVQNDTINGSVSQSLAVTVAQPLGVPVLTDITPFHNLDGIVLLDWTDIDEASHYYIYRDVKEITDLEGLDPLDEISSISSTYTDTITQSGMYCYVIVAHDGIVESDYSNNANVSIELPIDAPILDAITPQITLTGVVELNWGNVTNATIYYIFRSAEEITDVEGLIPLDSVDSPILTYSETILVNGVYNYAIVASDGIVNSSLSNCENVTVHFPPAAPVLDPITPQINGDGAVDLSWSAVAGTTEYYIYRSTEAITTVAGLTPIVTITSGETQYVDTIANNGIYHYVIVANDGIANSPLSNCENVTVHFPPAAPVLDSITPPINGNGTVELSWSAVAGTMEYFIYRSMEAITTVSGLTPIATISSEETQYIDTIAINGTFYYAVVAYDGVVSSELSNVEDVVISILPESEGPTERKGIPAAPSQYILFITGITVIAVLTQLKKKNRRS